MAVREPAFTLDILRLKVLVARLERAGAPDVGGEELAVTVADGGLFDPLHADDAVSVGDADGHRPGDG